MKTLDKAKILCIATAGYSYFFQSVCQRWKRHTLFRFLFAGLAGLQRN